MILLGKTTTAKLNEIKAEMHHVVAACLYQMGQLGEAEQEIRLAVKIEPKKENYLNTEDNVTVSNSITTIYNFLREKI